MMWQGLIQAFKEDLPINQNTPELSLMEGNTPLIPLENLSNQWDVELYVKYEGANPTGSFKDRGMVLAVAKAKEEGSRGVICASTGNTSASAAAYSARADLDCLIVIPKGKIALGKLAQSVMYGAKIFEIDGNFDQALTMVRHTAKHSEYALVNSVNPYRLEGQKTAAFEICSQLGAAPDILAIPVGNAGNISAYWKGFKEYHQKLGTALPEMRGFEAEGAAAIVKNQVIENPETIATAIRIGNPASWKLAVSAAHDSGGKVDSVTDADILESYRLLARQEGVFAEPASCASLAGIKKQLQTGEIKKGAKIVAVLTGNGLKDPTTAMDSLTAKPVELQADDGQLLKHLEKELAKK
ncbi:L-threonine synthase [Scopulibacillus darangshiensis]|uniref:Threonine synthase n=1 Tax=Scopulibacillus darangshiensis TaxID=442528 RepID=A0A4R2P2S1_9BACL|nr:threonine synthase [Scopulibacillus darangshiensis]TCP28932.1 L-threonine synthase [Scopulibacillus darangshiensis]